VGVAVARLLDCTVVGSGGFGLLFDDVYQLTGRNLTLSGNSVSHIVLRAHSDANLRGVHLAASPGDAILLRDTSSLFLEDLSSEGGFGGVLAIQDSYAYLLNATFGSPPRVQGNAEVDVAWKVRAQVLLEDGAPAVGATVSVTGATGSLLASSTTDTTGWTAWFEVLERTLYGSRTSDEQAPHAFNASVVGGGSGGRMHSVVANAEVTIRVDASPPGILASLDGPAGAAGWYVGPVTVSIAASDLGGGVVVLWWRSSADAAGWVSASGTGGAASTEFTVSAQGRTVVEYYAVDEAGNVGETSSLAFSIDSVPPLVEFDESPSSLSQREVNLSWDGFDGGGSGNLTFVLQVQSFGSPWTDLLNGTTGRSYAFLAEQGSYQFRLVATDAAGLTSDPDSASVTVSLVGYLVIRVVDGAGRPLEGATLWLDPPGEAHLINGALNLTLAPGTYRVVVSAPGFRSATLTALVHAGETSEPAALSIDHFDISQAPVETASIDLVLLLLAAAAGAAWVVVRSRLGPPRLGSL
jgi:hypothetical protein